LTQEEPVLSYYALEAIYLADERSREADEHWHLRTLRAGLPDRPSFVRRALARGTAAISIGAAAATRRLDERIADDLGQNLAVGT
jgi:hypothetical protein